MKKIAFLPVALVLIQPALADIRLPAVLSSNMVLQQQSSVTLWGWSAPAEKITVTTSWNNKTDSVVATRDANWKIAIATPAAGGPYTITLRGNNTILLENVFIGEVWVCSGQSNMEMTYQWGLPDIGAVLPNCSNRQIRFFQLPKTTSVFPQDDCEGHWVSCDSSTLKAFSAVAYFFGKRLNDSLQVPVGLISTNWGGTPAEVWTPEEAVNSNPGLKAAAAALQPANWWPYLPGRAWNAMIAPLTNYAIAGAIWYQGESNTGTAATYSLLLNTMIDAWRSAWHKNFPFYFVQIAPYAYGNRNIGALLREQQAKSLQHPNTGMAVTADLVTDTNDIHPKNKRDVGYRLANWALSQAYGKSGIAYASPLFHSITVEKGKAILDFDHAASGLVARGKTITEIFVAGADKQFYPAKAIIRDNRLVVWSDAVKAPVAVRYGFGNTSMGNLFSREGLPVCPFRTDDWPVDTGKVK